MKAYNHTFIYIHVFSYCVKNEKDQYFSGIANFESKINYLTDEELSSLMKEIIEGIKQDQFQCVFISLSVLYIKEN